MQIEIVNYVKDLETNYNERIIALQVSLEK